MNPYLLSAICIFSLVCTLFIIAQIIKNNSVADMGWGIGFILVAVATIVNNGEYLKHQKIITFLVVAWGLRLSFYILVRNWGKPEDFRYENWRKEWGEHVVLRSFFQVFMLQGTLMFIIALPVIIVNSSGMSDSSFGFLYSVGIAVWLVGFVFESVGDFQMYLFRSEHHNQGKIMGGGLWKFTRHPNYFGEAVQWWGIFLIAVPSGHSYISILSPVLITFLLLKVSGISVVEKKFEDNTDYDEYKRKTSSFIPWFPKK